MAEGVADWDGRMVVGVRGAKIGTLEAVYCIVETGEPAWGLVNMGFEGNRSALVPLFGAKRRGEDVQISVAKRLVAIAPAVDAGAALNPNDEARLVAHYGLSDGSGTPTSGRRAGSRAEPVDHAEVTRSEEELDVGTIQRPREVVRLTKRIVTDEKQITVPVRREEVVLERRPVVDATVTSERDERAARADEPPDSRGESVTLHEEEVVVTKRVVPKERVHLTKDVTTEDQTVEAEVRKEAIEIEREPVDPTSSA